MSKHTPSAARAKIAIEILKYPKPPEGIDEPAQSRRLDDCFEMEDGDEVYRIILREIQTDGELTEALKRRGLLSWINESNLLAQREVQPDLFGGEPQRIHRKLKIDGETKGCQLNLLPGVNDAHGQLVMFPEDGMPDELVFKPSGFRQR